MQTIFFLNVLDWSKRQLPVRCLEPFRAYCPLKYSLYLEKIIAFRYSVFKNEWKEETVSKYFIQTCSKKEQTKTVLRSSRSEALLNSPNNFLCVEVSLCKKDMHWNTPPCRELQQSATKCFETVPQSRCYPAWG